MKYVIETKNLTKKYGELTAVNAVNLQVKEGEIFGFLGPNGAGKTTTIGMLTTLVNPTSGTALVAGYDFTKEAAQVRSVIGVVPQSFSLFPELTAEENLWYIGKLYGMKEPAIKEKAAMLLKTVTLSEHSKRISGTFSGGMKQRLSVAASLMSSPKILFMDEPTTGLDPQSRVALRELTKQMNRSGITILYTTHDMEEADKLCDRIAIMNMGSIIALGTSDNIKRTLEDQKTIEIELKNVSRNILSDLKKLPFIKSVEYSGKIINLKINNMENVFFRLTDFFSKRKQKVDEIRIKEPSLEDVFIHLTKKGLRD